MPSANRMTTPVEVDEPQTEGRYAPLDDYAATAQHLRTTVHTGLQCSYDPEPGAAVRWVLD